MSAAGPPAGPRVRSAQPQEARRISELALRSKAHWGYSARELEVFREELTLAPDSILARRTHVLEEGNRLLGFFTLTAITEQEAELEHLFVDPDRLGEGHGHALFQHAARQAREEGFLRLFIQSDPNAAGFYRRLGAHFLRDIPSSIPGRTLPCYGFPLVPEEPR